MTTLGLLAWLSLFLAAIPACMILHNLRHFRASRAELNRRRTPISVVVPARNEESNIVGVVASILASRGVEVEVLVVDDQSTDATPELVRQMSAEDPRVRLVPAPELPPGWCGKQHACHVGAAHASHERVAFLDADVRLHPDCLAALSDSMDDSGAKLVSGFPRELAVSLGEQLLIPLIHFVLLGFLPLARMRRSTHPAFAAGCGQLFLVDRHAYRQCGGHRAIRASLMDGITLPRAFRRAGFLTDVVDATHLASCRMYQGTIATWRGLAKNATEGIAHPARIVPMSVLLFGGQVLPLILLPFSGRDIVALSVCASALLVSYGARGAMLHRFQQSVLGMLLHPLAILLLLGIQWQSLFASWFGWQREWRGRKYQTSTEPTMAELSPSR
jgi:glycosyltransferase involved in cell wall biosynthesis